MNAFAVLDSLISIAVIVTNTFTIVLFARRKNLLNLASNRLLLSLSVCDLGSGILVGLHLVGNNVSYFKQGQCSLCHSYRIFVDIFTTFLAKTTVFHLCGITVDRYISLFYALQYQKIVTAFKIRVFIFVSWFIAFFVSMMQIMWLYKALDGLTKNEQTNLFKYDAWYSVWSLFQFMVFPTVLLGWLFTRMFQEIRRLLQRSPQGNSSQCSIIKQQRHVCRIFAAMYGSFVAFTIPYFTIRFIHDSNAWRSEENEVSVNISVLEVCYAMKMVTSFINPLIYTVYNREFRDVVKAVFRCMIRYSIQHLPCKDRKNVEVQVELISVRKSTYATQVELISPRRSYVNDGNTYLPCTLNNSNDRLERSLLERKSTSNIGQEQLSTSHL